MPVRGAFAGGLGTLAIVCALWLITASALAADAPPSASESPAIGQLDTAPKFALVIGVDAYGKGWPGRPNAVRDAKLESLRRFGPSLQKPRHAGRVLGRGFPAQQPQIGRAHV